MEKKREVREMEDETWGDAKRTVRRQWGSDEEGGAERQPVRVPARFDAHPGQAQRGKRKHSPSSESLKTQTETAEVARVV